MPNVTAIPRTMGNGDVITQFVDSVGTSAVTYTYPKTQEKLTVRNTGQQTLSITVAGTTQTVVSGQGWTNVANFTSFSINAVSGVAVFETVADEKGSSFDSPEGKYITALGNGNFAYNTDNALRGWRIAKARLDSGIVETINLNFIGDSISEGYSGSDRTVANYQKGYVNLIRQQLIAKYGDVGEGFIPNRYPYAGTDSKWAYTGTWQNFGANGWMGGTAAIQVCKTVGGTATLQFNGTGIVILAEKSTAGGSVSIAVDGGTAQTWNLSAASASVDAFTVSGLTNGAHTLVITVNSSQFSLLGAYEIKGTKGIRVNTIAVSGAVINMASASMNLDACISHWTPKLSVISFLANDFNTQVSLSSFSSNWQAVITKAKSYGDVLITSIGGIYNASKAIPMDAYRNMLFQLAMDNNVGFLDIAKRWGDTYAVANTVGYLADDVHPNPQGHQDAANAILGLLLN